MTKPTVFGIALSVGAIVSPLAQVLAARYSHRHWLDVQTREFS